MVSAPRCPPGARGLLALLLLLPLPGARGSCDDPPYIRNTFRDHSDSNLFPAGTVVKYNCDGGYELIPGISSASVTCQKDFTWSEHQEFCRKIRCPSPDITNGKAIPRKETYMYEDKIRIDCNPGYALKDQNGLIKCERNRAWQPPLPICEPACEPPARIANGRDNRGWKNVFLVGSSVSYSCNRGWSLVGVSSIRCIAGDGGTPRWDAPTPECKGSCDDPPYIRNTFRDHSDSNLFPAGTVVKYNCVGGYELIPGISSASVTCQKDFTWSEHEELCRKIRCPYPNIRNGEVRPRKETYVYEDKIRIECDRGYALKDQNGLIKCERNRAWQPPLPICEPACEPPARIANGQDDRGRKNVFLVGSSVTYECDHGWSLVGVSSIRCTAGYWGTPRWDASVPECKAHISNRWDYGGWRNVFLVGSSVTYDCDRGWSLVGVSSVQCIDGDEGIPRWDAPAPECKSYCVDPPDIPNAVWKTNIGTLIPAGMVIKYGCRRGYKLITGIRQGHVTCLQNSTWSSALNFCQKVHCPAPDVNNGIPTPMPRPGEETYAFEDRVTIKCDLGYGIKDRINGNAQIRCKHDGTWDPAVPVCEPVLFCAQPPNISHGQYNDWGKRVFVVGSSVTYKCDRGFSLVGKPSIQCIVGDEVTPTWSEPTPQCEETQCPVPRIQHGSLKSPLPHNYTHRISVTFQCDPGYILRGADRIQCQADGKWYPQLPVCDLACEPPALIANGQDDRGRKNVFLVGSSVSYSCNRGWSLVGVSSIRCTADDGGTPRWDAPVPECKDIITQDKPTTVPPEGAEVAGTSSGSALNIAGNFAEADDEGRVIVIAIGISTGIGIVLLGAVPAIIAWAILKKYRIKVDAS